MFRRLVCLKYYFLEINVLTVGLDRLPENNWANHREGSIQVAYGRWKEINTAYGVVEQRESGGPKILEWHDAWPI